MESKGFDYENSFRAVDRFQTAYFDALETLEEEFYLYVKTHLGTGCESLTDLVEKVFDFLPQFEAGVRFKSRFGRAHLLDAECLDTILVALYDVIENTPIDIVARRVQMFNLDEL